MNGGDTLNIRGGAYLDDGFTIQDFKSGTATNAPTTIQAYNGEVVSYTPGTPPTAFNGFHGLLVNGVSNLVLNGFEVDATHCNSDGIKLTGGSTNIVVTNMFVHGSPHGMGILATGGVSEGDFMGSLITHCTVQTNGWNASTNDSPLHQIYIQTSNMTVENCTLIGVTNVGGGTVGIHYFGSGCNNGIFRNNAISGCNVGILLEAAGGTNALAYNNTITSGYSWGISAYKMGYIYILNNTCYTNNAQISVDTCTNAWVENNICVGGYANNPGGIYVTSADTVTVRNNLSYGNYQSGSRTFDYRVNASANITTNANLFAVTTSFTNEVYNANFISPPSNVSIGSGSNAINTGRTQTLFNTDILGNVRPNGGAWDIGAYEYQIPTTSISGALLRGAKL